jgi:hypothetical protein
MKRSYFLAAALGLCAAFPAAAAPAKVGWSLAYYPGWDQDKFPPDSVNWKAFTHVAHFTLFPNVDGSLDMTYCQLSDAHARAAVAEAHKHGVKIVICIGGAEVKDRFKGATAPENIHKFVKNLMDFMREYGYDGIDTDWEENYDDVKMLAWHKELRDSINTVPGKSLTIAGGGYFAAHCAFVHPYVDFLNTMSYDIPLGSMASEMQKYTSRGVPKEKLGVGIGIGTGSSMVDSDSGKAKGKVDFVLKNGFGGVMQWSVKGDARHTEIFKMLEQYVPAAPTVVWDDGKVRVVNDPALRVARNTITGMQEIRYVVPASGGALLGGGGAFVDLSLYTPEGSLLRRLVRGNARAGAYALPLDGASAELPSGTYLVRLSAGARVEAVAASITR